MPNTDLPNLNIVLGIIAAILTIIGYLTGWGKAILKKIKNLFIAKQPEVPRETLRIYPVLNRTWWHMGSSHKKAAMQIVGHFRITNITEKNVRVVGTRIIKPRKARKEGTVMVQHSQRNIYGHYPILPHATIEVSVDFGLQPPVCEYGEDFKATLVLVDQYTNEHKVKALVFTGDQPKETKKQEPPKEAVYSLTDPIEKQVVSVLKAEVDRYKSCGRRVGGLGSIQTTHKGEKWVGVGTRWKKVDSPKNQAIAVDPEKAEIISDNIQALLNVYDGLENNEQQLRFVSALLKRLSRSTEYASVGYLVLVVLFIIGSLTEALNTAKADLQNDTGHGFSDFLRLLEGLLFYKHPLFTLEQLDEIEQFLNGITEDTFVIPERIAAIRAFRLSQKSNAQNEENEKMKSFKAGDKVQIIDVPEGGEHLQHKTATVVKMGGFGYADDDVIIKVDDGGQIRVSEQQLKKIS